MSCDVVLIGFLKRVKQIPTPVGLCASEPAVRLSLSLSADARARHCSIIVSSEEPLCTSAAVRFGNFVLSRYWSGGR